MDMLRLKHVQSVNTKARYHHKDAYSLAQTNANGSIIEMKLDLSTLDDFI